MTRRYVSRSGPWQAPVQVLENAFWREGVPSSRGQFNCQRQTIQTHTDLRNHWNVLGSQLETPLYCARSFGEQLHGRRDGNLCGIRQPAEFWHAQRLEPIDVLPA